MTDWLRIDGSHGEGGGQILRTSLALAAITGRPVRFDRIRAGRRKPGLAAQHVTAVRAVAALCGARVAGDELGSQTLRFAPQHAARAGAYEFDVAAAREGGSAGAATLVLQAVMLPLAFAAGDSTVAIGGGTHMAWSPPYDYLRDVWAPMLGRMGANAALDLVRSGWFPLGCGEIRGRIAGRAGRRLAPLVLLDRGRLVSVEGRALVANLPAHIARRMSDRARAVLEAEGIAARVRPLAVSGACPGAGIFLTALYENAPAGFGALGRRGMPAETVADEAAAALLAHCRSGAALDRHLADQLLLPAALAEGESRFSAECATGHLHTNAWVIERFGVAEVRVEATPHGTAIVTVAPLPRSRPRSVGSIDQLPPWG